ncbi:hypothetical protein Patl1_33703 [Pistacia atlantica]|uniref:Uncharacterized protein n=1 Tax=Pistacia atlantica TaxID=434234 RepID=A0ACC0ZVT2_9ROSI|nr:hypothetical protein Patl1_33703 [Pistacia atlantica]
MALVLKRVCWKYFLPGCVKAKKPHPSSSVPRVQDDSNQMSMRRLSLSDVSNTGSQISLNDLSSSLVGSNLHIFTHKELEVMTNSFSKSEFLGEGGFGQVYKGFIDDNLRPGLKAQPVAVKVLDLNGSQGHREWLDYSSKLSDFGLATDGPQGDVSHITTCVMGTEGYAAPEYIKTGHLTAMCDVYSFGVVLLELLTGRKSIDKNRPRREQDLVEWARPLLKEFRRLEQIIDPRLEGQYSTEGVKKAALLAYQCLSHHPRSRPTMSIVVKTLRPLLDLNDIRMGSFVCTVSNDGNITYVHNNARNYEQKDEKREEIGCHRLRKGRRQRRRIRPSRSRDVYSDTVLYKALGTSLYSPRT